VANCIFVATKIKYFFLQNSHECHLIELFRWKDLEKVFFEMPTLQKFDLQKKVSSIEDFFGKILIVKSLETNLSLNSFNKMFNHIRTLTGMSYERNLKETKLVLISIKANYFNEDQTTKLIWFKVKHCTI